VREAPVPSSASAGFAFVNGDIVPTAEARVSVLDRGFLWGDGVYEVTPCFDERPFRLAQHIERLFTSLRAVSISLHVAPPEVVATTEHLLELNRDVTSSHRICRIGHWVTRGIEDWRPLGERDTRATLCILVQPVPRPLDREDYLTGVPLTIVSTRRSPRSVLDPNVKTTSRMNPILAEIEASASGTLGLMLDVDDHVAEGPTFNVFLVRGSELVTPRVGNVLPGITRDAVLELASALGIPTSEADISRDDIATADELFVTASTWGVLPVRSVDRSPPRQRVPGPVTMRLLEELARLTGYDPLDPRSRR
jgi:branched-chain amino acid aminotransferase